MQQQQQQSNQQQIPPWLRSSTNTYPHPAGPPLKNPGSYTTPTPVGGSAGFPFQNRSPSMQLQKNPVQFPTQPPASPPLPEKELVGSFSSQKRKRTLRILFGLLVAVTIVAIATGIYYYTTYIN